MRFLVLFLLVVTPSLRGAEALSIDSARFHLLREALLQAERPSGWWSPTSRDCAGFIRYLYRTAVGPEPFRDRHGKPAAFLRADELVGYNFRRLSRHVDTTEVRTGDLLAFYSPHKKPEERWHLMVLLRPVAAAPDRILAVYHNGDTGTHAQVRKVWLEDLERESSPQWRPIPGNARFLGLFRWQRWSEREKP